MQSLEMPQPNAIIFRLPDDDEGNIVFAEVPISPEGKLAEEAQAFGVDDEDSFNDMDFTVLVLARRESEDESIELASFDILDPVTGEPVEVFQIIESLDLVVPDLIEAYNNGAGETKQ